MLLRRWTSGSATAVVSRRKKSGRRSGLQLEVLAFYKECLKMIQSKDETTQAHWYRFVRSRFDAGVRDVSPRDVATVEFMLRKGRRMLEDYGDASVKDISGG